MQGIMLNQYTQSVTAISSFEKIMIDHCVSNRSWVKTTVWYNNLYFQPLTGYPEVSMLAVVPMQDQLGAIVLCCFTSAYER